MWAYRTPATPAKEAEMANAINLILGNIDTNRLRRNPLSRIDMTARPFLELIRFNTITRVNRTNKMETVKVAAFGVPVMPWRP